MKKLFIKKTSTLTCTTCKLNGLEKSKIIGRGLKKILIILSGTGDINLSYMSNLLIKYGIDLYEDCWSVNAIRCFSESKINDDEILHCRTMLLDDIKQLKPNRIFTFGEKALKILILDRLTSRISFNINNFTGYIIPDQTLKTWIIPLLDPSDIDFSDIERKKDRTEFFFKEQILNGINLQILPFPILDLEIECVYTIEESIKILELLNKEKVISFDYETTSIKPQKKGHRILCVSFSTEFKSFCFPFFENEVFEKKVKSVLTNKNIKKISHNMKFEALWTKFKLNYDVENWHFDTLLSSHILDNRSKVTSLKFQAFVNFGILGYDNNVEKFLETKKGEDEKSSNSFNRMDEVELDQLLKYCAIDSLLTFKLYKKHIKIIENNQNLMNAYNLFHRGTLAFIDIESSGIRLNMDKCFQNEKIIENEMQKIMKEIHTSKEFLLWVGKKGKEFNFYSTKQMSELLYDFLEYTPLKYTEKENPSTDIESLKYINSDFCNKILRYKKLQKLKKTYLAGFKREYVNGFIYPSFNLHTVSTYRSSANNPNFQNLTERDEESRNFIKSCIEPVNDFLCELDYSSIEVVIGSCYHQDPEMIRYILEPDSDMHRDAAISLFLKNNITKEERFLAKNKYVFAEFYGDYWKPCAMNLWKEMSVELKEHLKKKGINDLNSFSMHVKKIEWDFWNIQFSKYNEWRKRNWKIYLNRGFIYYKTGFLINNNMMKNVCNNSAIQGTAFHCLLTALIEVNTYFKENSCKTKILGQIHDSLLLDVNAEEWKNGLDEIVKNIFVKKIREIYDWIIVPLKGEIKYFYKNWSVSEKTEKF